MGGYFYSFLAYGVSLALKPQAIFFLPFLILLFCKKMFSIRYFLLIPIPNIIFTILASLCGANFFTTLKVLGKGRGVGFSYNAASLPMFLFYGLNCEQFFKYIFIVFCIVLAVLFCAIMLLIFLKSKKELSLDLFVLWAFVITFSMPFLLPSMHERFFYIAEIFALIYLFMKPRYFYITGIMYLAILNTYLNYIFHNTFMSIRYSALLMIVAWIMLLYTLYKEIKED